MRRQDILNREPPRPLLTNVEFPLGQRSIKMRYVAKESKNAITRLRIQKKTFSEYLPKVNTKKRQIFLAPFGRTAKPRQWFYIETLRLFKNITLLARHYTERLDSGVGSVVSWW